jgi:hypothetical protein
MVKEKRSVTPEKAIEILEKHGTIVTLEEVKLILDFMYKFGKLAIDQQVNLLEIKNKKV